MPSALQTDLSPDLPFRGFGDEQARLPACNRGTPGLDHENVPPNQFFCQRDMAVVLLYLRVVAADNTYGPLDLPGNDGIDQRLVRPAECLSDRFFREADIGCIGLSGILTRSGSGFAKLSMASPMISFAVS